MRDAIDFDVVVVGAGPAGLSCACRLRQLALNDGTELSVCVLEKGSEVGAHILSGALLEPVALDELFPDWQARGAPVETKVTEEVLLCLTQRRSFAAPGVLVPAAMGNRGNYVISLAHLCRWLARQAESSGVEIFPGFAAAELLFGEDGGVRGVITGDMGVGRDGKPKANFQPGMEVRGKYTVFAEGCRGHLGKRLMGRFDLESDADPQRYGIGIKEVWDVDPARHRPGFALHTFGWPLDNSTEGGGFLYHMADGQVSLGFIVALDYANPYLNPFEEMQRWKLHPKVRSHLDGGRRVAYGARAVNKGGWQAVPKLSFPGGVLVGCEAGFLNGVKIKGIHNAMKTGMLAAEAVFEALSAGDPGGGILESLDERYRASRVCKELYRARNFGPALSKFGALGGSAFVWFDQFLCRGRLPFTLHTRVPDHTRLKASAECKPVEYPRHDGRITFDILSSVYLSNTNHEEDQPCHLKLADPALPVVRNLPRYAEPAQRYCPAGVFEIVRDRRGDPEFLIHAQNCIHCKTCDIKDPAQNIEWTPPEGGGGPNYGNM